MTKRNPYSKTYSLFVRKTGAIQWDRISCNALTLNRARHHFQSVLISLSMTPGVECRLRPAAEITDEHSMLLVHAKRKEYLS